MVQIITEIKEQTWRARLARRTDITGLGESQAEAIGDLILQCAARRDVRLRGRVQVEEIKTVEKAVKPASKVAVLED